MAKVVAIKAWLNPEKDSDGMTCAESAEGWETNSVCLLLPGKWKLPTKTAVRKHNVNESSQTKSLTLSTRKMQNPHAGSQTTSICFRDGKLVVLLNEVCQRRPVKRRKTNRCCCLYQKQNIRAISDERENTLTTMEAVQQQ